MFHTTTAIGGRVRNAYNLKDVALRNSTQKRGKTEGEKGEFVLLNTF